MKVDVPIGEAHMVEDFLQGLLEGSTPQGYSYFSELLLKLKKALRRGFYSNSDTISLDLTEAQFSLLGHVSEVIEKEGISISGPERTLMSRGVPIERLHIREWDND